MKSSESCQKFTSYYISAQNKSSTLQSCPCPSLPTSHRHTCTPYLAPVHTVSPIYHRLCRVTLVLISQSAFFALLWCEWRSCGRSIKIRVKEMIQLPGTRRSAAGDRWPGQEDRCESATGVWKYLLKMSVLLGSAS